MAATVVVGCGDDSGAGDAAAKPKPVDAGTAVRTPAGLLRWMADNPARASLVVLPDRGTPLTYNPGRPMPLASTRKVLIAGAAVEAGGLRGTIARSAVERFYVPGTDGGSHRKARLTAARLPLADVAEAMLALSDNAAADALLERVGAARVDAWAAAQGMREQDPIYPLLGEFAAWGRDAEWTQKSPRERAVEAAALARTVKPSEVVREPIADSRSLTGASVAGTAAEWAALLRRIERGGTPQLRRLLSWPLRQTPKLRAKVSSFLAKGGTLDGVLTDVSYVRARGSRSGAAVALFLRDLPADVQKTLRERFTQQTLAQQLALDPAFREKARAVLAPADD
ncbi:serine hydrolase [Paraconexibacter sp. AEG42_29]|uniref:serine hydrolase n=1 Tax=Paraconexibacter sp. AEG42_29 TaxID=2997339 RepID=UPI00339DA74D